MNAPPPYPRIPYLLPAPSATRQDRVVAAAERAAWWGVPLLVEEKLDGANVALWLQDGQVQVASRGGPDAMDRAGQLGRLRAWVSERSARMAGLLSEGRVAYAEWLWLQHGIAYDALPDWLVILDLWTEIGFVPVVERDRRCADEGLVVPPRVHDGPLLGERQLPALMGRSAFSRDCPAEGLVLRRADGARAKVVSKKFARVLDEDFSPGRRNSLTSRSRVPSRSWA